MLTVSEAAEKLGIPASTIRFYDNNGLLPSLARTGAGARSFTEADLAALREITAMLNCGFSVRELEAFIRDPSCRRAMLLERRAGLEREIERAQAGIALLDKKLAEL